jgi:hypothetical protein
LSGDSSNTIAQIRQRLFISGDLSKDSKSALYDKNWLRVFLKYKDRSGNNASTKILPDHIKDMNIPVGKRIKTLLLIWNAVDGFQMISQNQKN